MSETEGRWFAGHGHLRFACAHCGTNIWLAFTGMIVPRAIVRRRLQRRGWRFVDYAWFCPACVPERDELRLPPPTFRQRLAQIVYLLRFWSPWWSWQCVYREDRGNGATRRQAFHNWLEDGLGSYWRVWHRGG